LSKRKSTLRRQPDTGLAAATYSRKPPSINARDTLFISSGVARKSMIACFKTDFTEDLKKIDAPTQVMHGENDQIVPVKDSAKKSANSSRARRKIYYPERRTFTIPW
jgi:pimeloyl-ACP methyl ester carboxylesterase